MGVMMLTAWLPVGAAAGRGGRFSVCEVASKAPIPEKIKRRMLLKIKGYGAENIASIVFEASHLEQELRGKSLVFKPKRHRMRWLERQ